MWSPQSLETSVYKGAYALACTPEANTFTWGDMQRRIKDSFIILLTEEDAMRLFGDTLKLTRIAALYQAHRQPRLIINLSEKTECR